MEELLKLFIGDFMINDFMINDKRQFLNHTIIYSSLTHKQSENIFPVFFPVMDLEEVSKSTLMRQEKSTHRLLKLT